MVMSLLAAVLVAQAPPLQLASPDLTVINLEANRAGFFSEHFAQQLTQLGLTVVTARQISALLGQERQKQLMGCGEDSNSCIAELANALGSDGVITGSVARIGSVFQVNVAIISGKDGKPLSVLTSSESSEEGVLGAMSREAPRMAQEVVRKLRPGHELQLGTPGVRKFAWIPAGAGVVLLAVSTGLTLSAWSDSDRLRGAGLNASTRLTYDEGRQLAADGKTKQTVGITLGAVGIAALAAGAGMLLFGAGSEPRFVFAPVPGGGALAVGGSW